jgi:hypothetical protein
MPSSGPGLDAVQTAMRERDADTRRDQEASPEERIMNDPDMGEDGPSDEQDEPDRGR